MTQKLVKVNISIGELFDKLNLNNSKYEETQHSKYKIYIENVDGEIVPILGYVKKHVNLCKYTYKSCLNNIHTIVCSDKHILIDEHGKNCLAKDAKYCQNIYDGILEKINEEYLGEGDAYDIAIKAPHLYFTTNGIIHHNTTLTKILAADCDDPLYINASLERGIDTIREKIISYASSSSLWGGEEKLKVVILEECDNLTNDAWSALRATIEQFHRTTRFIGNCNYIEKIPEPIQSRFNCIPIDPVNQEEELFLLNGFFERTKLILGACKITYKDEDVAKFVKADFPDMRAIIKKIQQLYTRGIKELTAEALGTTFDCGQLFNIIMTPGNPTENYKALVGDWSTKAEDGLLMLGQQFPKYIQTVCPDKINKLPMVIITICEYQSQLHYAIDKFIVLLALIYKLQNIMNS